MAKPKKEKTQAKKDKEEARQRTEQMIQNARFAMFVVAPILALVSLGYLALRPNPIYNLSVTDTDMLQTVFYSGEPWVVSCYKGNEPAVDALGKASEQLAREGIKTGMIDCNAKLPSGKTVAQRVGLTAKAKDLSGGRTIFFAGNGKKITEMASKTRTQEAIVKWALKLAALRIFQPSSPAQMRSVCYDKKLCGVLYHSGKITDAELRIVQNVAKTRRKIPFVLIDSKQQTLSGLDLPQPGSDPASKFLAFHRPADKNSSAKTSVKYFSGSLGAEKIRRFLDDSATAGFDSFKALNKLPLLSGIKGSKKSKPSSRSTKKRERKPKVSVRDGKGSSRESSKGKEGLTSEKEKQRRKELDEEMANMFTADEDTDEDGTVVDSDEEIEEEVVEEDDEEVHEEF
eukprot:m.336004 g.336004  ORF g.336004 m.336004 type:complete len:400 (+) comp17731_c0_seq1:158-1357(+)